MNRNSCNDSTCQMNSRTFLKVQCIRKEVFRSRVGRKMNCPKGIRITPLYPEVRTFFLLTEIYLEGPTPIKFGPIPLHNPRIPSCFQISKNAL